MQGTRGRTARASATLFEPLTRTRAHSRIVRIFHLEPGAASSDSCISSKYVDALAPSVLCDAVLPPQLYRRCAGPSAAVSSDRIYSHGYAGALPVAVHAWEVRPAFVL